MRRAEEPRNIAAAKVVGTGLVAILADVLQGYDVDLVTVVDGRLRIEPIFRSTNFGPPLSWLQIVANGYAATHPWSKWSS